MATLHIGKKPFLVFGRAGMDLYADPPGTETERATRFYAALGGSAGNIAAGIARLGGKAELVTAVSQDAVGRFTVNELKRYGIGTRYVGSIGGEARNSLAVVETRAENCQSVIYRNNAADFQIAKEDIDSVDFTAFGAMIVTGTCFAVEPSRSAHFHALSLARAAGIPIVLDVDYRPYSWTTAAAAAENYRVAARLSDIVIGNDDEFAVMAGEQGLRFAEELASNSAKIVIYKMGERGSITFSGGHSFKTGIFTVRALKPTGAGDAFLAAFVMSLASGRDLETSVRRGSAAAALVVTRVGCAPAMPIPNELEQFLAEYEDEKHAHPAL
jgi:5-dehydro-2-deoxygluconokinase